MAAIAEWNHVTKNYKGRGVFDLCLKMEDGETLGFLGPNGAGKTTTIRQMMGFIRPDSGTVRLFGQDPFACAALQARVGYLPGETSFPSDMTGGQFIRFLAQYRGLRSLARAKQLAEYFELDTGAKLKKMSKGTKQKVAIVCAFMHDPQLYVLDEPTSGLDPLMQSRFVELLQEEQKKGKTILLSSHIFEEVEKTCTRTAIIRAGHIAAVKDMQALSHSKRKYFTVRFETPAMAAQFAAEFAGAGAQGAYVTLPVAASQADAVIKRLAAYKVEDLSVRAQTLEELFMHFYGGEEK